MEKVKVSVILPTYNGGKYIKKSIESVVSQSCIDWELLIIDDGSTDNTKYLVEQFFDKDDRIIYLKNEKNLGIQKSLNRGLKVARGEYIARIDDDDIWEDKDKLKKQVEFLDKNKDYILVGVSNILIIDSNYKELYKYNFPETDNQIRKNILGKNCFAHSSVLFRKDIVLFLGGYNEDEKVKYIEDYDLWLRLGQVGRFANISNSSISFMIKTEGLTYNNRITQATRVLCMLPKYRKEYHFFIRNYFISIIKLLFFCIKKIIPMSNKIIYKLQAIYKNI